MSPEDAPRMVALTMWRSRFFRRRTNEMGEYFGIRSADSWWRWPVSGWRPGWREISALHSSGDRQRLCDGVDESAASRARCGRLRSFLLVIKKNARAIALYKRMGFVTANSVPFGRSGLQIEGKCRDCLARRTRSSQR